MSNAKRGLFVFLALVGALVFIRLGFWQLHRRTERLARNALVSARYDTPEVDVQAIPRDTTQSRFMKARVAGVIDYAHELTFAARSYKGSPGINFLTPVHFPGNDTAVLVDRGWIYTPDGATVDHAKWHDRDSVFVGYVEELPSSGGVTYINKPTIIARLSVDVVAKALPFPVLPFYVVAMGDSANAQDRVARLAIPPLDEGPHMGYAIQWFTFALIAIVGAGVVLARKAGS